jgi:hypothetical protein
LLQEFDLSRGATLIGRSSECQVTIEDPLVSRQHARIVINGDEALLEDLGSRNGVKLNGSSIAKATPLRDGDRLRIGTQELVFCRVEAPASQDAKTTGFLRHCTACRLPYPREMVACPSCGASEQPKEEETLSGQFGATSQGAWSVQLLVEVLEKALVLGRTADAERMLRRATAQVEERLMTGDRVDAKQLQALSVAAAKMSLDLGDATWGSWIAQIHRRMSTVPAGPVIDSFAGLIERFPEEIGAALGDLASHCRRAVTSLTEEDARSLARLEQLRAGASSYRSSQLS